MTFQMALDERLFESQKKNKQEPFLRFYHSSGPWISVGCSFRRPEDLQASGLLRNNSKVPFCRRITGGGCVLHGEDLIFSLFIRTESDPGKLGAVRTSYAMIHEAVRRGFLKFGGEPVFYEAQDDLEKGADCFDFPVQSDLRMDGKKVAGGAQKRSVGVLLHHESVRIPEGVAWSDLAQAIREGFEEVFSVTVRDADLDPEIYFQAERLAADRALS